MSAVPLVESRNKPESWDLNAGVSLQHLSLYHTCCLVPLLHPTTGQPPSEASASVHESFSKWQNCGAACFIFLQPECMWGALPPRSFHYLSNMALHSNRTDAPACTASYSEGSNFLRLLSELSWVWGDAGTPQVARTIETSEAW